MKINNKYAAILFIDLDHFKDINDSLGHDIGDTVLKMFASKISMLVFNNDTVARLGGDEFVILLARHHGNLESATQYANKMATKIHESMREPIYIDTHNMHIKMSIGITIITPKDNDVNDILKHADEALKKNEFELYYQPIIKDDFIPYAESNDLILEIGEWVIQRVCIDYKELREYVKKIAINISIKQFKEKSFAESIVKSFKEHNIDPNNIELELTESVILNNLTPTIAKMKELKSYGFTIAIDDFGTGYSSLSYLKELPFDFMKIDRSFIKNILINESDASLVKTILAISKQFNFSVIAEGVESHEHIDFLREFECNFIQGYIISKAIKKDDFKKLLL